MSSEHRLDRRKAGNVGIGKKTLRNRNTAEPAGTAMTLPSYTLGISPCPNDTYIFEALIHGRIRAPFTVRTHTADVEELNAAAADARLDIT
jgi:hypothetical protein